MERAGEQFATTSDTEVLLRLLRMDGPATLDRLRGMFAFAAWNDDTGELIIARDRIGKKPFYYAIRDDILYFSSALSSLRTAIGDSSTAIDATALDHYLTLGYVPAPHTIWRGISKLEAGHLATITDGQLTERRYWSIAEEPTPFAGSYMDALDTLEDMLTEAVDIRLRSDVPLGIFLSGGIDSSLVASFAAAAVAKSGGKLRTFSIGFGEARYNESRFAAEVADALGTEHHLLPVDSNLLDLLPAMAHHFGEPFADASAMPMWKLAELARPHVTVALGGDGGDEGFAGYEWYRTAGKLDRIAGRLPAPAARAGADLVALAVGATGGRVAAPKLGRIERALRPLAVATPAIRYAMLRRQLDDAIKSSLYVGDLAPHVGTADRADALTASYYDAANGSALRRMRHADIATYLADNLMPKVDVTSMAHGLEVRAPLLDHEIVRFGLSLPDAYLYDHRGGKRPLRDLLARRLPTIDFDRPKQGFTPPVTEWLRKDLKPKLDALRKSDRIGGLGLLRMGAIGTLIDDHVSGRRDHGQRLFSLLILDQWLAGG